MKDESRIELEFEVWGENDEDRGLFKHTTRVTRAEYELLKDCCRKGLEPGECRELKTLCRQVEEGIIYSCALYEEYGMEHPYSFTVYMPQQIADEVRAENSFVPEGG